MRKTLEEIVEDRSAELKALREEWKFDEDTITDFYTHERSEKKLLQKGLLSDCTTARPHGGKPMDWAKRHGWPLMPSWSVAEHESRANTNIMAREVCRRAQYYYNMYVQSDQDPHVYTDEELESFPKSLEYITWVLTLDQDSSTYKRAMDIQRLVPQNDFQVGPGRKRGRC